MNINSKLQPIETAPKDGTMILIVQNGVMIPGWYGESFSDGRTYCWNFVDDDCEKTSPTELTDETHIAINAFDKEIGPTHWISFNDALKVLQGV